MPTNSISKEELEKRLPDLYEDKKLGRTDLTLNEMFERGYNSCLLQCREIINSLFSPPPPEKEKEIK
jgi:hypothetical protein